jgi:hypothetical protein
MSLQFEHLQAYNDLQQAKGYDRAVAYAKYLWLDVVYWHEVKQLDKELPRDH